MAVARGDSTTVIRRPRPPPPPALNAVIFPCRLSAGVICPLTRRASSLSSLFYFLILIGNGVRCCSLLFSHPHWKRRSLLFEDLERFVTSRDESGRGDRLTSRDESGRGDLLTSRDELGRGDLLLTRHGVPDLMENIATTRHLDAKLGDSVSLGQIHRHRCWLLLANLVRRVPVPAPRSPLPAPDPLPGTPNGLRRAAGRPVASGSPLSTTRERRRFGAKRNGSSGCGPFFPFDRTPARRAIATTSTRRSVDPCTRLALTRRNPTLLFARPLRFSRTTEDGLPPTLPASLLSAAVFRRDDRGRARASCGSFSAGRSTTGCGRARGARSRASARSARPTRCAAGARSCHTRATSDERARRSPPRARSAGRASACPNDGYA